MSLNVEASTTCWPSVLYCVTGFDSRSSCGNSHLNNVCCFFQLVELSNAQDIEAGDGTTSVVVVAGSLLEAAEKLLGKGIHPTGISDAFQRAAAKCVEILNDMAIPVELSDQESLVKSASTALNSKVGSNCISVIALFNYATYVETTVKSLK